MGYFKRKITFNRSTRIEGTKIKSKSNILIIGPYLMQQNIINYYRLQQNLISKELYNSNIF